MATDDHRVENIIMGNVDGTVTQVETDAGSSGKVRNVVTGNVAGAVTQAGDISGPLTF